MTDSPAPHHSRYLDVIGPSPECAPGDRLTALDYLHKIEYALANGDWSKKERERLAQLREKWYRRAFGMDARFELMGTRAGRVYEGLESEIRRTSKKLQRTPDDEQRENLLESLRLWRDADLPSGRAKGIGVNADGIGEHGDDTEDPEPGDLPLPTFSPRQYLIPGQDQKGHGHRVYCRVMPAHWRGLAAVERSKGFGFRTIGDVMRWCIDYGIRELLNRQEMPQVRSALAQVDVIREILNDEQYYMEYADVFQHMTTIINRHLQANAPQEAMRLIAKVRHEIEQMGEEYWREKFSGELMRQFGHLLEGGAEWEMGEAV